MKDFQAEAIMIAERFVELCERYDYNAKIAVVFVAQDQSGSSMLSDMEGSEIIDCITKLESAKEEIFTRIDAIKHLNAPNN